MLIHYIGTLAVWKVWKNLFLDKIEDQEKFLLDKNFSYAEKVQQL